MKKSGFIPLKREFVGPLLELKGAEIKVYLLLLNQADFTNGIAKFSIAELADCCHISYQHANKAIKNLVEKKYIEYRRAVNQYGRSEATILDYPLRKISKQYHDEMKVEL